MKHDNDELTFIGIATSCILLVYSAFAAVLSLWTDRNLEFWISYFKECPVDVAYWKSFLLTFFLPGVSLVGNIFAEIIRCCI